MQVKTILGGATLVAGLELAACTPVTDNAVTPRSLRGDFVFTKAKVYTVNKSQPWAEAVVVDDNRITYVGDNETALTHVTDNMKVIDLKGRMVLPGMIDTHVHPGVAGLASSLGVTLNTEMQPKDYLAAIKAYAEKNPDAPVIAGFGFVPPLFGPTGPTKEMLDSVVADRPVFIISGFGHSAWANSKALTILDINKDTPDPHPGAHFYRRDPDGNPTGHLVEGSAFWSYLSKLGIGKPSHFETGYANTLPEYATIGITSFFDAGTPGVQENAFIALRKMEKDDKLPVRYHGSFYVIGDEVARVAVKTLQRLRHTYESDLLRLNTIKVSNDGQAPEPGGQHLLWNGEQLGPLFTEIAAAGVDVMIHATNDHTVHETLNGIEIAKKAHPDTNSRFTITHMDFVRKSDFPRFAELDIIAGVQPMAAEAGFLSQHYMPENVLVAPLRSLIESGVILSGSSDFPACGAPLSGCTLFHGMEVSVTRQGAGQPIAQVLTPESERLSLEQAIYAHTMSSAYQIRRESDLGSLEQGKLADLIVVDQNLFAVDPQKIHETKVPFTMMNGRAVYDRLN